MENNNLISEESLALKEEGNCLFHAGKFEEAIEKFTAAIAISPQSEVLYCNRSMCYSGLRNWDRSIIDAKAAVLINKKYQKAYYRIVKGYIELKRFKEARLALLCALSQCGEQKDLKLLEELLFEASGHPLRPKPTDFEIIDELGTGNFTTVFKAKHKKTGAIYAIKTIEKANVEKMKRRHPNITNEIFMEKRVLNKLNHPNIVEVFSTFQDYGTLYYHMEYLPGGELWPLLKDNNDGLPCHVGCYWSLARFYLAEAINVIEYMHRKGVVHRDIKPENIMITANGHIKFVDFGTAKDLVNTNLNGQDFVGTPEYLPPSTINNKPTGPDGDLWALGVLAYQLFVGYTPFAGASPYLSFLRIKRALVKMPAMLPPDVASFIRLLLTKNADERLLQALGSSNIEDIMYPPTEEAVSTDILPDESPPPSSSTSDSNDNQALKESKKNKSKASKPRKMSYASQFFGPRICYDALRKHPFFSSAERHSSTYSDLESFASLHDQPAVRIPLLSELAIRAVGRACQKVADLIAANGGIRPSNIGWVKSFNLNRLDCDDRNRVAHFLDRCNRLHNPGVYRLFWPSPIESRGIRVDCNVREYIGFTRSTQGQWVHDFFFSQIANPQYGFADNNASWAIEESNLKQVVSAVNKQRPRFVIVFGNLTNCSMVDDEHIYDAQITAVRLQLTRISDTIPVLYIPGEKDIGGSKFTAATLAMYRSKFGADYYGFWYSGFRVIVLNSSLMIYNDVLPEESAAQDTWLEEEIELSKLSSTHIAIFTFHPWFLKSMEEENMDDADVPRVIPFAIRVKWLKKLRHHKVGYLFTGSGNRHVIGGKCFRKKHKRQSESTEVIGDDDAEGSATLGRDDENECLEVDKSFPTNSLTNEPLKPSEIIADAVKTGEIEAAVVDEIHEKIEEIAVVDEDKNGADSSEGENDEDDDEDDSSNSSVSDDEREDFVNEDADYEGPILVDTPSICANSSNSVGLGVQVVKVFEHDVNHEFYTLETIPKQIIPI